MLYLQAFRITDVHAINTWSRLELKSVNQERPACDASSHSFAGLVLVLGCSRLNLGISRFGNRKGSRTALTLNIAQSYAGRLGPRDSMECIFRSLSIWTLVFGLGYVLRSSRPRTLKPRPWKLHPKHKTPNPHTTPLA